MSRTLTIMALAIAFLVAGCAKQAGETGSQAGKVLADEPSKQSEPQERDLATKAEPTPEAEGTADRAEKAEPAEKAEGTADRGEHAGETGDQAGKVLESEPPKPSEPQERDLADKADPAEKAEGHADRGEHVESSPSAPAVPEPQNEKPEPQNEKPEPQNEKLMVAHYKVSGLEDINTVRALTFALADKEGVVSAKADKAAGLFKVTYRSGCPHGMQAALRTVAPDATLAEVVTRDGKAPPTSGCGSCPKKDSCAGAH